MLNRVILMGRLTADPDLRQTPSGIYVATFNIAVDRTHSKEKQTDFLPVVVWRNTAEFVSRYFSKGQMIIVEGSLQSRSYEDKNGQKRTAIEVVAQNVQFGEPKRKDSPQPQSVDVEPDVEPDLDSEDLPF